MEWEEVPPNAFTSDGVTRMLLWARIQLLPDLERSVEFGGSPIIYYAARISQYLHSYGFINLNPVGGTGAGLLDK